MIPKISVNPLATRNSSRPYCTAFRHWTRKVARSTADKKMQAAEAKQAACKKRHAATRSKPHATKAQAAKRSKPHARQGRRSRPLKIAEGYSLQPRAGSASALIATERYSLFLPFTSRR